MIVIWIQKTLEGADHFTPTELATIAVLGEQSSTMVETSWDFQTLPYLEKIGQPMEEGDERVA